MCSKEVMIPVNEVSEIFSSISSKMDKMKKEATKKDEHLGTLKEIAMELKEIANRLEQLGAIDDYVKNTYGKLKNSIDEQKAIIDSTNVDIMCKVRNETIQMIKANLPDNMVLKNSCENKWQLYRIMNIVKNKKTIKEETYLGEMNLTREDNLTVIEITIEGNTNKMETIRLESAYKIYPIVNYIRMHCDYSEV